MNLLSAALLAVLPLVSLPVSATEWYVAQSHPQASDDNPGTEIRPFKTIQKAVNVSRASDTLWVKAGVYEEAVTLSRADSVNAPTVLAAWSNDSVRIGSVLRDVPSSGQWQALPGTRSWSVQLAEAQPADLVVLLDGKAIVTQQADTPPADDQVNWATYRASDRTLMVNVGGPAPLAGHRLQLARNFTGIRVADTANAWILKRFEFAWCGTGIELGGDWIQVQDCFFHDTYRYGVYVQGRRHTLYRCNFHECGYAIGGENAGPAHIIEQCLVVRCGQEWQDDIALREQNRPQGIAPVDFSGCSHGQLFRYNILADNWGPGLRQGRSVSSTAIGNAFWDNVNGNGLWNDTSADDTLIIGNYFRRNDLTATMCSRVEVVENFFERGGIVCRDRDQWPVADSYLVIRQNGFVAPPAGYLRNYGSFNGLPVYSNGFCNNLVDWNRIRNPAGSPWLVDGTQTVNSLSAITSTYGWEVHGEGRAFDAAANDLTPEAMRASSVTFRVPWGPRSAQARTMLGDGRINGWPAAPELYGVSKPPGFFWLVADGNSDSWVLQDTYQRYWNQQRRWKMLPSFVRIPSSVCNWYTDAEDVYPVSGPSYGEPENRAELSSGNRWLVLVGGVTNGFPVSGIGYWSPWLATAPGARTTIALKLRGAGLTAVGNNTVVVRLDFLNATGQDRQRCYLVGYDGQGAWHRPELTSGSYDWTTLSETITAPTGAVRMALFMGLLPSSGEVDFDDMDITTESAPAPDLSFHLPFQDPSTGAQTLNVYDGSTAVVAVAGAYGAGGSTMTNATPSGAGWARDLPVDPLGHPDEGPGLVIPDSADRFRLAETGSTMTVAAWVCLRGYDADAAPVQGLVNNGRSAAGDRGWSFGLWDTANTTNAHTGPAQLYFQIGGTATVTRISGAALTVPVGVWTHVAVTWTAGLSEPVFFINGIDAGSSGDSFIGCTAGETTNNIVLALHDAGAHPGNVMLDEVRLYRRLLTAPEIVLLGERVVADLALTHTVDNATARVGDTVTFTLGVTNRGPSAATGVTVKDALPAGLGYVAHAGGDYTTNTGFWALGSLDTGSSASLQITAVVTACGTLTNTAEVQTVNEPDPDSWPGNDDPGEDDRAAAIVTVAIADLEVTATANEPSLRLGSNVMFTILVTNKGPATATGITIKDLLPTGLAYAGHSGGSYDPGTGLWDLGALNALAEAVLQITATATQAGALSHTVEVWTAGQTDPDSTPGNGNPAEDDQMPVAVWVQSASATNFTWTGGGGGDTTWTRTSNWTPGTAYPKAGDFARFDGFADSSVTIGTGNQTVEAMTVAGGARWTWGGSGTLTVGGGGVAYGSSCSATSTLSAALAGPGGLTLNAGTLNLYNAGNSFSGGITLNAGILVAGQKGSNGDSNHLGNTSRPIVIGRTAGDAESATLLVAPKNPYVYYHQPIVVRAGTAGKAALGMWPATAAPQGARFTGGLTLQKNVAVLNNALRGDYWWSGTQWLYLDGAITGNGGVTTEGLGVTRLTGTNSYTGQTIVEGGYLFLDSATNSMRGSIAVNRGYLYARGDSSLGNRTNTITLGAPGTFGALGGNPTSEWALVTFARTLTLAGNGGILTSWNDGRPEIEGVVSGPGKLIVAHAQPANAPGFLSANNTYGGGTLAVDGALKINGPASYGNTVYGTGSVVVCHNGSLAIASANNLNTNIPVLVLRNTNETVVLFGGEVLLSGDYVPPIDTNSCGLLSLDCDSGSAINARLADGSRPLGNGAMRLGSLNAWSNNKFTGASLAALVANDTAHTYRLGANWIGMLWLDQSSSEAGALKDIGSVPHNVKIGLQGGLVGTRDGHTFTGTLTVDGACFWAGLPSAGSPLGDVSGPVILNGRALSFYDGDIPLSLKVANVAKVSRSIAKGALTLNGSCYLAVDAYDNAATWTTAVTVASLIRSGRSTVAVRGQRGFLNERERWLVGSGLVSSNGMTAPYCWNNQNNQFLDYDANGFKSNGWDRTSLASATATDKVWVSVAEAMPAGGVSVYALRADAAITGSDSLTNLSGGVILTGNGVIHTAPMIFGSNEAVVYCTAANTLNGTITGSGGLTKSGSGILTLGANNAGTLGGPLTINEGYVLISTNHNLGVGPVVLNGGGLLLAAAGTTVSNSVVLAGCGGTLSSAGAISGAGMTFAGDITGTGPLRFNYGTWRVKIAGTNNTYSGGTYLRGMESISVASNACLGTGPVCLDSGTGTHMNNTAGLFLYGDANVATGQMITLRTRSSWLHLASASPRLGSVEGNGVITLGQSDGALSVTATVGLDSRDAAYFGDIYQYDYPATPCGIIKAGSGTWAVWGNLWYNGPTIVSNGTLLVNNCLDPRSPVTVCSNAALGGIGTVGNVIVAGGTLMADALHVGGLTLTNACTLQADLGGPGLSDALGAGAVQITGSSTLSLRLHDVPALGRTFRIIDNTGSGPVGGMFANVPRNGGTLTVLHNGTNCYFQVDYRGGDGNDVILTVVESDRRACASVYRIR